MDLSYVKEFRSKGQKGQKGGGKQQSQGKSGKGSKNSKGDCKGKGKGEKAKYPDDKPFDGDCGRCGRWGHRQKDCYAKINNTAVEIGDDESCWGAGQWEGGWGDDDSSWGATPWENGSGWSQPKDEPEETRVEGVSCTLASVDGGWVFATATTVPGHGMGTSVGRHVDLLVDSGANRSVCGPSDFPGYDLSTSSQRDITLANGSKVQHYGDKCVNFSVNGDPLKVHFHVTDVAHPIIAVSSINENEATVTFPAVGSRESASITRRSRGSAAAWATTRSWALLPARARAGAELQWRQRPPAGEQRRGRRRGSERRRRRSRRAGGTCAARSSRSTARGYGHGARGA